MAEEAAKDGNDFVHSIQIKNALVESEEGSMVIVRLEMVRVPKFIPHTGPPRRPAQQSWPVYLKAKHGH